MLYEIKNIRQHEGEHRRRWFFSQEMDLTVWFDQADEIFGFQLSYDRTGDPHALTWRRDVGYQHNRVDDGEGPGSIGRFKGTPMLLMGGRFDRQKVSDAFESASGDLPEWISDFVAARIETYSPESSDE